MACGGPKSAYQTYLNDHLQRMHNEIEQTTKKLELERRRLNKLKDDVDRTRTEYEEKVHREKKGGGKETDIPKLEKRLAKHIAQLNALVHGNKGSRDNIDQIRRERLQMNQVLKQLHTDIKDNAQTSTQMQMEADANLREKEEARFKAAALKKRLELGRREFKEGVTELQGKMIETEREQKELEVSLFKKNKARPPLRADEEDNFSSSGLMRRILKVAFLNTVQRRHIRQHQKNIEVFEQAFATIKSTTGISDIEEIVKIFVRLEQKNYSLLTYVNVLNREIEAFEERNRELRDQIASQKKSDADSEKRRRSILADLKQQIANTSTVTQDNVMQATQQKDVLERCRPLIQAISRTVEKENRGFGGLAPNVEGDEVTNENVLQWLTYIERTLMQWRDFLPDTKPQNKPLNKTYKYTVGHQVMGLPPKKHAATAPLVRATDLPSAANILQDPGAPGAPRGQVGREGDSDSDEDDMNDHPCTRQELRNKALASVAKRKKNRKQGESHVQSSMNGDMAARTDTEDKPTASAGADGRDKELGYEAMVEKQEGSEDGSEDSEGSEDDDVGPNDEEINEIFLKRYKLSREELQKMAEKMGIQLNNLCYLKQEFDAYDEDRSGYIDARELKELLEKLGEELSEDELDQAFHELDQDGSGEIEFFEFVEWFTSED